MQTKKLEQNVQRFHNLLGALPLPKFSIVQEVLRQTETTLAPKPAHVVTRPLSGLERLWLTVDKVRAPFAIQMILEGTKGQEVDLDSLRSALQKAARVHPGSRMRLVGALEWAHWISDGPEPEFRVVEAGSWKGDHSANAAFLDDPLDAINGPTLELVVVKGDPLRLVFRAHHANMDGAATILFARDFFAALRGEPLQGTNAGPPIDADVAKRFNKKYETRAKRACRSLTGPAQGSSDTVVWCRISIPGQVPNAIARLSVAVADAAETQNGDKFVLLVPVDMRQIAKCEPSSANLSCPMPVPMNNALRSEHRIQTLDREVLGHLMQRSFTTGASTAMKVRNYTVRFMARFIKQGMIRARKTGLFYSSIVASHLGSLKLADFSGGGFNASNLFFLPIPSPVSSLFIALCQTDKSLEITGGMPEAFASGGRLERLMERTAENINKSLSSV